jgi:PAS domain S-box-containing protein
MNLSLRSIAWAAFALATVLMVGSSVLSLRATGRLRAGDALVAHTHEVEVVLEDLGSKVFQASNSRRAFAITGNESLLADYRSANEEVPKDLDHLRRLTADNPARGPEVAAIAAEIQKEFEIIAGSIQGGESGISSSEKEIQVTLQTAELGDRVHRALQKMREEEDQMLAERQSVSRANYQNSLKLIWSWFILAFLLLLAQMFLLSYEFSRHQRTEFLARQSQEIVDAFFSSSTVGFAILDSQFRCTRYNDVFRRMTVVEGEVLAGRPVSQLLGENGQRMDAVLREVLAAGKPVLDRELSSAMPGKPEEVRHWLVNYFPIREGSERFQVGIIAIDVTARHKAEDALRKLSGRLLGMQDQERRRIARELHDSLGQYLAALKITIEMLGSSAAEQRDGLLAECAGIIDKAITETRTLSHLLHPPLLDEAGFASAASWFVTGFAQRSGIPVSLDLPPDLPRLPEAVEIALFRVLQESLTNVHRHSRAASAEIRMEGDAEQITIEIRDHGDGIPQDVLRRISSDGAGLGVGLAGMRERIHELRGVFEVSSDEHGTTVRATVPWSGDETRQKDQSSRQLSV